MRKLKNIVCIIMLFSLTIVQAHDIIQHEHDHLSGESGNNGISHEERFAHFELSDIFAKFNHSGNGIVYSRVTNKNLTACSNVLKIEKLINSDVLSVRFTNVLRHCIRDNPDQHISEIASLNSLRAPPALFF